MTLPTLYGIPNCDSVRKARSWLAAHQIDYRFVDFKDAPPKITTLNHWLEALGATQLVNRRSATYRQLNQANKNALEAGDVAAILAAHPTLMKRPVLDWDGAVSVGFSADGYARRFGL